jgi:uncharacterized protein
MISADRPIVMTERLTVEVVYAEPERYWLQTIQLDAGATVADALALWDAAQFPAQCRPNLEALAVFGQKVKAGDLLHDLDRIELLRPLSRDPKDTRRLRAAANPIPKRR